MKQLKFLLATMSLGLVLTACGGGGNGGGNPGIIFDPNDVDPNDTGGGDNGGGDNGGGNGGGDNGETVIISGVITEDMTLNADVTYILDGFVVVGEGNVNVEDDADVQAIQAAGVTLTIEPGTNILAASDGALLITRGSQIMAEGTPTAPITFSSLDDGFDGLGEWGGVIIQGFAPQFGVGGTGPCFGEGTVCNVEGEGGTEVAAYGGNIEDDNSGILRYVRIAEGGLVAGPNNEINGLTLQGVGHGTQLEFIQVHNNLDDGIEWFGGTVNATFVVLTNNDDDSLDYDEGYQGNVQFGIVQMLQDENAIPQGSNDPRGIEANSSNADFVEETNAVFANLTIVGGDINANAGTPGAELRGAVSTGIYNTAIEGFEVGCFDLDDAVFAGTTIESNITLVNVINDCVGGIYEDDRIADGETNVTQSQLSFDEAFAIVEAEALLTELVAPTAVDNGSGFEFVETDYVGAVEPGTLPQNAWWAGWTIPGSLFVEGTE